jgi:protease I
MKKVLIISADQFEDTELLVPYYRLKEAGIGVTVSSTGGGRIKGKHGYEVGVDASVSEVDAEDFDALVLPGGKAPAALRKDETVVALARRFMEEGKPVAAICHGPQVLVTAGVMRGRRATSYRTVAVELKGAGAEYEDREVVVDGNLVTSRQPGDLPAFTRELMRQLR